VKTVRVPDDWCENCRGTGTTALNGAALTAQDLEEWSEDELADYASGQYDTVCDICDGTGKEVYGRTAALSELRAEAPHMFI
jgi:hypothetical protein